MHIASGGGLHVTGGALTIAHCTLHDNIRLNAGGAYAVDSAAVFHGCRFVGNHGTGASANGGALNLQGGAVTDPIDLASWLWSRLTPRNQPA